MEDLSLHILDIAENSIRAKAKRIEIRVIEDLENDLLSIEIKDDGCGMDRERLKKALDPFFTTKDKKWGLGLSLLAQATQEAEGEFNIDSAVGKGTKVSATFKHSHIDRKPFGNMAETLIVLIYGNPDVDFFYLYKKGSLTYSFDTSKIKAEFGGNSFKMLKAIKEDLKI
jgi:anti-sigma regulatory factor (Ser/Thr protein kinase)